MINNKNDDFNQWFDKLNNSDKKVLISFFDNLYKNLSLSKKQTNLMINDFQRAILRYDTMGISLEDSIKLLSPDNLGNMYLIDSDNWYPLDFGAKIFPFSMNRDWMAIFRISAYLKEDIIPEILQMALNFTIKRFPYFATTIKNGFFWHYLDCNKRRYFIKKEDTFPCNPMNISKSSAPSFKVYYFKNRISVEFFHILTDGNGGSVFVKTLVAEYIKLLNKKIVTDNSILDVNDPPSFEEASNDFIKNKTKKYKTFLSTRAVQIDGKLSKIKPCQILHFDIDANDFKNLANKKGVTVTNLMLGFIFMTCNYATSKDGYIKIQVPVDMRKYYDSKTLRNFALYVAISIKKSSIKDFDSLLLEIKKQLDTQITADNFAQTMAYTNRLVNSIKYIPLFIKTPLLKIVYKFVGDRVFTTVLSNLGKVKTSKDMEKYIKKMDVVLGTSLTNKVLFSMITFNQTLTLSISKLTTNQSLELNLYSLLINEGIVPTVYGSEIYENKH